MLQRLVSMHCHSSCQAGSRLAQSSALAPSTHSLAAPLIHALRQQSSRQSPSRLVVRMGSSGKFFVGGNWKSNGTKESVSKLVKDLNAAQIPSDVEVIVAPTYLHLPYVAENIDSSRYQVSAQNCWVGKAGAFTGEVCRYKISKCRTAMQSRSDCANVRSLFIK